MHLNKMSANSTTKGVYGDDANLTFWLVVWVIMMVLFVIGVVANILILVVLKRTPSMHSVTNVLLCNLAVSDLMFLLRPLLDVVVSYLIELNSPGPVFDIFCKFLFAIPNVLFACSVLTLTVIAVERYQALVNTMASKLKLTSNNVKYIILAVWIIGFVSAVPDYIFVTGSVDLKTGQNICSFIEGSIGIVKNLTVTFVVLVVFVPMKVICFCYFRIIYGVYVSKTILSINSAGNEETRMRRKLVKISMLATVAFILCFGPRGVITVLFYLELLPEEFFKNRAIVVVYVLSFLKPIINPFLYAFQSTNYHVAIKSMFRSRCCKTRKSKQISP